MTSSAMCSARTRIPPSSEVPGALPDPYAPPATAPRSRPSVVAWFRAYAASMSVLYLIITGAAVLTLFSIDEGLTDRSGHTTAAILLVVSALLASLYAGAAALPLKPWAWTAGIVAIAIGLTGCTIVFALPLLVYWLKPQVKAAFGRPPL